MFVQPSFTNVEKHFFRNLDRKIYVEVITISINSIGWFLCLLKVKTYV